ncbi:MAG: hypothetical protein KatS3mg022_1892 [Armatimonadota bacterium]|nr:MAG: hypothetical protein KatS3mg022_1892 [Armatimonadota bacterium]
MKLLTFLGTTPYWKTDYVWSDKRCETEFIAEAIASWLHLQDIVVFLTEKAEQSGNWKQLQERLQGRARAVRIPDGRTEQEIWEIFEKVVGQVHQHDVVVLDVTHAFRSLPMLLTVAAAFLRAVREVRVEHIFYAPSEREQRESTVMDLILLLHWMDWMEAVRRFRETGDARWIGDTLTQTHDTLRATATGEPRSLKKAGKELGNLAQALHLARPIEVAQVATRLRAILPEASQEVTKWVKPFSLLVDKVTQQTSQLSYEQPQTLNRNNLQTQLDLIHQLLQYGLTMQAVQAAREWLINWAIWYKAGRGSLQKDDWLSDKSRNSAENDLNSAFRPDANKAVVPEWLREPELHKVLQQLWPGLCNLRNDIAHCGMRLQPLCAKDLQGQSEEYLRMLEEVMNLSNPE